jgi:hypothetical protein
MKGLVMSEAKLMCELALCCRRIADHQQDPTVQDILHDLEQDFIQKAKISERRDRTAYLLGTPMTSNAKRRAQ